MTGDALAHLAEVLPGETAQAWHRLAPLLPDGGFLAGGTAIAVHLRHRVSRDLDFFFEHGFDRDGLLDRLSAEHDFAATELAEGTINGVLGTTKVQFLDASPQTMIVPPVSIAGIRVAMLDDLLAMKLKVVGDRGQLRDYYDLMAIEQQTDFSIEQGFGLFVERYRPPVPEAAVRHALLALGYLDDVADDPYLEGIVDRVTIERYWHRRQPQIARAMATFGSRASRDES